MRFTFWQNKLWLASVLLFFGANSTYLRVMSRMLFEGQVFKWSYESGVTAAGVVSGVSGLGLTGDVGFVAAMAFIIAGVLFSALRRPDRVSAFLLFAWSVISLLLATQTIYGAAEPVYISMDTIGIQNELMDWRFLVFPAFVALVSFLLLLSMMAPGSAAPVRPWTSRNTLLCVLAAASYGVAAILLNMGAQHGNGDLAGIIVMYAGFMLALFGLAPWEKKIA